MGRPLPGIDATILRRDEHGDVVVRDGRAVEADAGEEGELALRPGWPSMFRGYLGEEERYRKCFAGGWYCSGDLATRDADGWFWFVGRGDDVIKSAGHLIGPFEVESALMEHPAVAEAGVIGKPDPIVGAVVKAFVVAAARLRADRRAPARAHRLRPQAPRRGGRPEGDRVPPGPPEDAQRQDHAPPAPRPRARAARRRPVDAGVGLMSTARRTTKRSRCCATWCASAASRSAASSCTRRARIRGFLHLYIGEEAVAVGVMHALTADDAIVATYREHGHALVRGVPARAIMAEMYGKIEGCSRGRGGSMHLFDAARRFYGGNAIVAGGLPGRRRARARREDAATATASSRASSARARSPRASSTSA